MAYLIYNKYWKDVTQFRVNELADRSYFTPFSSLEDCDKYRFYSPYVHLLSGKWKFLYKDSVSKMKDFYKEDFDITSFDDITVPSCWQTTGYDSAQYQSSPYTFIFDPPFVPDKNPAGAYVKEFDFNPDTDKNYELHFEGKDSCIYVWLNGEFIGYGEVPHNDSVFDITKNLKIGKNRLAVMVLKRCTGTYLDDQDKIRLSGLFRDVYILARDKKCINDFFVHTFIDGTIKIDIDADAPVCGMLFDKNNNLLEKCDAVNSSLEFKVENPNLWTAETPYLYKLVLCCGNEYICRKVGIREVKATEDSLLVNGVRIKMRGVNRHDSDPNTGYTVSKEHIERDLRMIKESNFNTIRTAHYTNMADFYELCDEIGLYVIAEADMECHGCYYTEEFERIVENPLFLEAICDRICRATHWLKNFPSVIMWSLGNESSWGANLLEASKRLKKIDSSRPLHYEAITMVSKMGYTEDDAEARKYLDVYSRMYTPTEPLKTFYDNKDRKQPFMMCEYSHAMGNSCGDLTTYEKLFDSDPHFIGGCIWEWCDHAIETKTKKGTYLAYGGDFGDNLNLRNVCMDGLVSAHRVPHSSLYEAKAVFSPVQFTKFDKESKTVTVENRNSFISLENYNFFWSITLDGVEKQSGTFSLNTPALSSENVFIDFDAKDYVGFVHLNIKAERKDGTLVREAQFELCGKNNIEKGKKSKLSVKKHEDKIKISTQNTTYTFSTDLGMITSIKSYGKEMLNSTPEFICWRAPTDNDSYSMVEPMAQRWGNTKLFGKIEYAEHLMKNICVEENKNYVSIKGDLFVAVQGRCHITEGKIEFKFTSDGGFTINHTGKFNKRLPYWLPRYGIVWPFKKQLDNIDYLGLGPYECYPDKCSYAMFGAYSYTPDNPEEMYEKPQECGNRLHTKKLTVKNDDGFGFNMYGDFSFSASNYDIHEKAIARHQIDINKKDVLYLYTDYFMSGVGSRAVGGHVPGEEYRINGGDKVKFKLEFHPFNKNN